MPEGIPTLGFFTSKIILQYFHGPNYLVDSLVVLCQNTRVGLGLLGWVDRGRAVLGTGIGTEG